jgi:hypothetical protein
VVLAILMIASFVVSEYEYNKVQEKYQNAVNEANATLFNQTGNMTMTLNETIGMLEPEKHHKKHKKHHRVVKDDEI